MDLQAGSSWGQACSEDGSLGMGFFKARFMCSLIVEQTPYRVSSYGMVKG